MAEVAFYSTVRVVVVGGLGVDVLCEVVAVEFYGFSLHVRWGGVLPVGVIGIGVIEVNVAVVVVVVTQWNKLLRSVVTIAIAIAIIIGEYFRIDTIRLIEKRPQRRVIPNHSPLTTTHPFTPTLS